MGAISQPLRICPVCEDSVTELAVGNRCPECRVNLGALNDCPSCSYDLTGLPRSYRCPECGFEYDATMCIWQAYAPRALMIMMGITAILLLFSFLVTLIHMLTTGYFSLVLGYFGMALFTWLCLFQRMRSKAFVALGKNGISFRGPLRPVRSLRWCEISLGEGSRKVFRVSGGKRERLRSLDDFLSNAHIRNELSLRLRRWQAETSS